MWGKNQENQKPLVSNMYKEDENNKTNELTKSNDLNDLIESYDINKINEEDYDKLRYLNDLNKEIEQEKDSDNEEQHKDKKEIKFNDSQVINGKKIDINQKGKNQTIKEVDSDNEEEYLSEFREIELMRIELEKSLKLNLFKAAYHIIFNETDRKENKYDKNKIEEKIKDDFKNKGYNDKEIDETIQKIPKIFEIVIKERIIEQ